MYEVGALSVGFRLPLQGMPSSAGFKLPNRNYWFRDFEPVSEQGRVFSSLRKQHLLVKERPLYPPLKQGPPRLSGRRTTPFTVSEAINLHDHTANHVAPVSRIILLSQSNMGSKTRTLFARQREALSPVSLSRESTPPLFQLSVYFSKRP